MAKTFCNTPLNHPHWHRVDVGQCFYLMSAFWIDTTSPCDMMDYDFTMSIAEAKAQHEEIRLMNIG